MKLPDRQKGHNIQLCIPGTDTTGFPRPAA